MAFDPTAMKTLPTCEEVERTLREMREHYEQSAKGGRPKDPNAEGEWMREQQDRWKNIQRWEQIRKLVCGDQPTQQQRQPEPAVEDEGSGLDIPTISVPGVAARKTTAGPGAPTKSPFAAAPRGLVFMVPIVVVLLVAAAVRAATSNSPQIAAESAVPTTTSVAATANAIPTTTSRPPSGQPTFRVTGQTATYSGGPRCADTFVTFAWTIDGLGDTGNYNVRFGDTAEAGPFTIRPGAVNAQNWDPATHRLTLKQQTGISGGDVAVITKVNNTAIAGDGTSKPAAPVNCTQ